MNSCSSIIIYICSKTRLLTRREQAGKLYAIVGIPSLSSKPKELADVHIQF